MLCRYLIALLTAVLATAGPALGQGQEAVRTFREWEPFQPGSWKQVRVYRETFDENEKVASTSTTETKTTLIDKDEKGFTLQVEVTVEVEGTRFPSPAQTVWYGFNGESKEQTVSTEKLGSQELDIDGRKVTATVYHLSIHEGKMRRDIHAACSDEYPFVYQLHSVLMEPAETGERALDTLTAQVTSIDLPFKVLDETKSATHIRTTLDRADSKTVTVEVHCADVPGRVVAHWSKKTDAAGKTLEKSTLELVDYGTDGERLQSRTLGRRHLFGRSRGRSSVRMPVR